MNTRPVWRKCFKAMFDRSIRASMKANKREKHPSHLVRIAHWRMNEMNAPLIVGFFHSLPLLCSTWSSSKPRASKPKIPTVMQCSTLLHCRCSDRVAHEWNTTPSAKLVECQIFSLARYNSCLCNKSLARSIDCYILTAEMSALFYSIVFRVLPRSCAFTGG